MSWKKDKRLLYILVPVVIGIWGLIGWRIVDGMQGPKNSYVQTIRPLHDRTAQPDTFFLSYQYDNPFGIKQYRPRPARKNTPQKQPSKSVHNKPKKQVAKPWPAIQYMGMMKNVSINKQVAILSIGGKTEMVPQGEQWQGVKVLICHKDSVRVEFENMKKSIQKSP